MKITIFGATGRTGTVVLHEALQQGHTVTAYVRNAALLKWKHPQLQVMEGQLKNIDALRSALTGRQAVISTLGVSKTLHHDTEVIAGIGNIVKAMQMEGVQQFIYQSVFLANSQPHEFSFFARNILKRIIRNEVEDHELKEDLIRAGIKNYTIVRPVKLTNQPFTGQIRHGLTITSGKLLPVIARADVAHFMLQQLTHTAYQNQAVRIM